MAVEANLEVELKQPCHLQLICQTGLPMRSGFISLDGHLGILT